MNILLTNDDGIYADGLWALYKELDKDNSVCVVAPDRERSAIGHAITLHEPLRVHKVSINGSGPSWAVSGTPVDCIKLGLLEILKGRPDMVIAGINPGANVGINVNYSGTVSAAREATLYGVPAIAVSMDSIENHFYEQVARFMARLAKKVHQAGLSPGTFLNVNYPGVPKDEIQGVRVSRQSMGLYAEFIEKRTDPRNKTYYWQGCDAPPDLNEPDIDAAVLNNRYISITPIQCDMTDYRILEKLGSWNDDY